MLRAASNVKVHLPDTCKAVELSCSLTLLQTSGVSVFNYFRILSSEINFPSTAHGTIVAEETLLCFFLLQHSVVCVYVCISFFWTYILYPPREWRGSFHSQKSSEPFFWKPRQSSCGCRTALEQISLSYLFGCCVLPVSLASFRFVFNHSPQNARFAISSQPTSAQSLVQLKASSFNLVVGFQGLDFLWLISPRSSGGVDLGKGFWCASHVYITNAPVFLFSSNVCWSWMKKKPDDL